MTITVDRSRYPSVFDAGLPTIDYGHAENPDEAHEVIRRAREKSIREYYESRRHGDS